MADQKRIRAFLGNPSYKNFHDVTVDGNTSDHDLKKLAECLIKDMNVRAYMIRDDIFKNYPCGKKVQRIYVA